MKSIETAIANAIKYRRLNFLITETFDLARSQSLNTSIDHSFSMVVKDCFAIDGIRMTCASKMLADYRPTYTATIVDRLIRAGGALIGKSNHDEFCMGTSSSQSYFGPVRSPWRLPSMHQSDWLIPGGSSGGSAVAVAIGAADVGIGSDTGGSTRNPAAFCGLTALKPSYGLLSRYGLVPLVNSLDCPALIARSIATIDRTLGHVIGIDHRDSTSIDSTGMDVRLKNERDVDNRQLVIGLPIEYFPSDLSVDNWHAWNKAAEILHSCGYQLKHVSLPHTEYSIICYHVLGEADIASNMARYDGIEFGYRADERRSSDELYAKSRSESLNEIVRRRILAGNYFLLKEHYDRYFGKALRVRRLIANDFYRLFRPKQFGANDDSNRIDALLTPVASQTAPAYSQFNAGSYERERCDDYFTQPANMAGLPAISIPVGLASNGLPVGVQIITDWMHDGLAMRIAQQIESSVHFQLPCFDV